MNKRKYHTMANVAAFISVIVVSCLAIVFGPLLILILIIYRCIFPKKERTERELMDEAWEVKHQGFIVSRH